MPPTLREFKLVTSPRPYSAIVDELITQSHSAALSAEKLLSDPYWDRYLMKCQYLLEEAERARDDWKDKCVRAVRDDDRIMAQWNYHACDARATTLREVMGIPKELIDAAQSLPDRDRPLAGGTSESV